MRRLLIKRIVPRSWIPRTLDLSRKLEFDSLIMLSEGHGNRL
jgi:hypothetical protein